MSEKRFASENFPPEIQAKADQMNLDPQAVPPYDIPALPISKDTTVEVFEHSIRRHLLDEFRNSMYGEIPPMCEKIEFILREEGSAFDNLALRRQIDIVCTHKGLSHTIPLRIWSMGSLGSIFKLSWEQINPAAIPPSMAS